MIPKRNPLPNLPLRDRRIDQEDGARPSRLVNAPGGLSGGSPPAILQHSTALPVMLRGDAHGVAVQRLRTPTSQFLLHPRLESLQSVPGPVAIANPSAVA